MFLRFSENSYVWAFWSPGAFVACGLCRVELLSPGAFVTGAFIAGAFVMPSLLTATAQYIYNYILHHALFIINPPWNNEADKKNHVAIMAVFLL